METEEEDYEQVKATMGSDHDCACCNELILLTDEVVCMTIVVFGVNNGILERNPALADDQDFLYEPRFMEYECWEDVVNELYETLHDTPPIIAEGAVASCRICESSILLGEITGLAIKGELQYSPRMPEGVPTTTFDPQDPTPDTVCIVCLKKLADDYLNLWDEVEQGNECSEGTSIRCWRFGCVGRENCMLGSK